MKGGKRIIAKDSVQNSEINIFSILIRDFLWYIFNDEGDAQVVSKITSSLRRSTWALQYQAERIKWSCQSRVDCTYVFLSFRPTTHDTPRSSSHANDSNKQLAWVHLFGTSTCLIGIRIGEPHDIGWISFWRLRMQTVDAAVRKALWLHLQESNVEWAIDNIGNDSVLIVWSGSRYVCVCKFRKNQI